MEPINAVYRLEGVTYGPPGADIALVKGLVYPCMQYNFTTFERERPILCLLDRSVITEELNLYAVYRVEPADCAGREYVNHG